MWIIGGGGFLAVLFAFTVTFFPPSQLPVGSPTLYTALVATGTVIFLAIPIIISVVMGRPRPTTATATAKHPNPVVTDRQRQSHAGLLDLHGFIHVTRVSLQPIA